MHLIRDALEARVEPALAAKVLFEALDKPDAGEVPQDVESALRFARGPLARTLAHRVGEEAAVLALADLEERLTSGSSTAPSGRPPSDTELETRAVSGAEGMVKVLIVSRNRHLVERLGVALGPHRVAATSVSDLETMAQLGGALAPDVIIVDGQNGADIEPADLAQALSPPTDSQLVLVWATDQPWGSAVSKALDEGSLGHVEVPRSEGVDPLLDYLRARSVAG